MAPSDVSGVSTEEIVRDRPLFAPRTRTRERWSWESVFDWIVVFGRMSPPPRPRRTSHCRCPIPEMQRKWMCAVWRWWRRLPPAQTIYFVCSVCVMHERMRSESIATGCNRMTKSKPCTVFKFVDTNSRLIIEKNWMKFIRWNNGERGVCWCMLMCEVASARLSHSAIRDKSDHLV